MLFWNFIHDPKVIVNDKTNLINPTRIDPFFYPEGPDLTLNWPYLRDTVPVGATNGSEFEVPVEVDDDVE